MSFSPSGLALWVVAMLFVPCCALPALVPHGARYTAFAGVLIAAIAALDLLISWRTLDRFRIVLPPSIRAVLNEEQAFAVELHRDSEPRRAPPRLRIAVALPFGIESIRDDIVVAAPGAGSGVSAELALVSEQRGEYTLTQAFLGAASTLHLWQLRRTLPVQSRVLVQPALAAISKQAAKLLASHRHGGQRIVARNGRGREFEQLREYVPNDEFGDIDWKATARRRIPIVREFQVERTQDIYACIDFSRLSARPITRQNDTRITILDEYIRSTLMLHCAVRETGDRFGFATFSDRVHHFVKAANANSFDPVFRQALYPLCSQLVAPAFEEISAALRTRAKRRALVVFFTNLAEPQLAEAFLAASRLLARQHLLVVACPVDAYAKPLFTDAGVAAPEDIYGKLAGHLLWKKLAEVRLQLAASGIRMHLVAPGRLGLLAATEYLDIKERQLL
ncbi:MAG TPA: DUF58 domain-containing protein [Bryobacteraceae bacterium]|jgi:uncharacterized protein (DUF58 family)|nr:DUF58 domain-containing protein [Bryobacteraceae bacterium]